MPDPVLDSLTVTARSPDTNIEAEADRRYNVTLRFRPGTFQRYDGPTLEHQLGQLARLCWVAYQRRHQAALKAAGRVVNDWSPAARAYREALAQTEVRASSDEGHLEVSSVGMQRWSVRIGPGALPGLSEEKLVAEVTSAVAALGVEYEHAAVLLKEEHFGFDLPPRVSRTVAYRPERQRP